MGRKYVRDKAGRFAPKGGGSKGKGGKMGKSAKNVKARAAYKNQAGKLREAKKAASRAAKGGDARRSTYAKRQLGGAKSGMTRVSNRLTKKRAAKSGLKETFASQRVAGRKAKFKSKTTKGRAAKAEWKAAKRADRRGDARKEVTAQNQKRVIKKQTGKKAYVRGWRETPGTTKAPRAGSKTKAQKIRSKIDKKKFANKELRGSEFKGAKKRKPPRTAKGKMAYDGPNKAASEARDRIVARTKAIRAKKGIKAPTAFGGTGKYARQGRLSKASKGSGAKQKYKKATSELRKSKRGSSLYQQSQMGHSSKRKQGQVTRLTNKFTNKRKAASSLKDLEKKIPKKTKNSASNKIVGFKRKKKR
jgi:hypothetical protein